MVTGGMTCVKYLLFVFNLIFAITGIVFISVGAVILNYYNGYSSFIENWFFAVPVLMIILGIIVFLVSFFGCCGAVKENHCMIITFSVLLLLIFALEIGAGIFGYMMRSEAAEIVQNRMNNSMPLYNKDDDVTRTWNVVQQELHCCGIRGTSDWWTTSTFKEPNLPSSCCTETALNAECEFNEITVSTDGCMYKLKNVVERNAVILGAVGIGIALVQLVGVIFACCLARSIRREYETV